MNIDNVIDIAASRLADFEAQMRGAAYERKGFVFSEMFIFVAAALTGFMQRMRGSMAKRRSAA